MTDLLKLFILTFGCAIVQCGLLQSNAVAQVPSAGPEYEVLKNDAGEWDVEITNYATGTPEVTKGIESNRMLGDFWLISNFEGKMMGLEFKGHGSTGYDAETKKYVGTWVDSLSPGIMHMKGNYDKDKKTMTLVGIAPGMDGNPAKHRLTTVYMDRRRVMTMYITPQGSEETKFMQLAYTRKEK
ncbi:DUF1579 domain-containing protein [Neorhodopirellula pilleata]|uniref:DUF1579 domain-containing protein n=1 Tax=Neorhodopirellula pilleata TaxID=2714738 RepID=A0A5C5ZX84_9BACT|nr:DUF1579 domain-containing protein [Neorhodopirellula pilleata]TWT92234.1 hypothetical protein Pla100_47710 [Neorhodopirellula pilleata]